MSKQNDEPHHLLFDVGYGGALFGALVSGEPSHMMVTYYHPIYVGCRFKLPPHADRLAVEMIQTADFSDGAGWCLKLVPKPDAGLTGDH